MTLSENIHNDTEILKLFRDERTREQAFRLLLDRYKEKLYWHIRSVVLSHTDTDDILQNVFIKVWKNLLLFKEQASLYTWLYRIATNETISFIKQQKRNRFISFDDYEKFLGEDLIQEGYFTGNEIQRKLQKAIMTLPEKQRIVFQMKYFEELKYEEMSRILRTSIGALKASYHHAVKKIENFLKNN